MLRLTTRHRQERRGNSPPEIEMVPQEIGWDAGTYITKERNEHMKFGWRLTWILAVGGTWLFIAGAIVLEYLTRRAS
jgi:hypothetical protein